MACMSQSAPVDVGALTVEECLRYLATPALGRLAVSVRALPAILPVRFVLDHGEILFRVRAGSVLAAGTEHAVVAFEADGADHAGGVPHSWSVVATGLARHVSDDSHHQVAGDVLRRWSVDGSDVLVVLTPSVVTGRRVRADW
jgi:nitroimidazol reductase NimA-like FMN-containing flavoprotein (pyridoxamine 5'-phosphate oxidase superfamily)